MVESVELLGLSISRALTWNNRINETIKKTSMRLHFLVQLRRGKVARTGFGLVDSSFIRSIMDYEVPVFHLIFKCKN